MIEIDMMQNDLIKMAGILRQKVGTMDVDLIEIDMIEIDGIWNE
jgi:hypothetical protein